MLMRTKFDFYHFMTKQSIVAPQQGLRAIDFRMPTPASNRLRMTEMWPLNQIHWLDLRLTPIVFQWKEINRSVFPLTWMIWLCRNCSHLSRKNTTWRASASAVTVLMTRWVYFAMVVLIIALHFRLERNFCKMLKEFQYAIKNFWSHLVNWIYFSFFTTNLCMISNQHCIIFLPISEGLEMNRQRLVTTRHRRWLHCKFIVNVNL